MITNNYSNCALLIDITNNNRLSTDLCLEKIERTVLEKSDAQGMLDVTVKSSADANGNDCEYIYADSWALNAILNLLSYYLYFFKLEYCNFFYTVLFTLLLLITTYYKATRKI